jgi:hypothetical protein
MATTGRGGEMCRTVDTVLVANRVDPLRDKDCDAFAGEVFDQRHQPQLSAVVCGTR